MNVATAVCQRLESSIFAWTNNTRLERTRLISRVARTHIHKNDSHLPLIEDQVPNSAHTTKGLGAWEAQRCRNKLYRLFTLEQLAVPKMALATFYLDEHRLHMPHRHKRQEHSKRWLHRQYKCNNSRAAHCAMTAKTAAC
jgi:hypothetical protein